MSFLNYKEKISEGDTVILFLGHNSMHSIIITADKVHQTKYGAFPHSDMIGRKFGTKMFSKNNKGWIFLLHPTPELWTLNLPHRTQILYSTDISMAIMQLGIKPGSTVIESGTGSGSMSHALIRTVAPSGHLYTFEFHEERAQQARKEFEEHKVDHLVTVTHRDVLKDGFKLDHIADAVFLDLPSPWDAIATSKQALKEEGGRISSFSPCIEQVQKTCETMRSLGFKDIQVMECLVRSFDVRTVPLQVPDLGSKLDPKVLQAERSKEIETSRKRKLDDEDADEDCDTSKSLPRLQDIKQEETCSGDESQEVLTATDSSRVAQTQDGTDPCTGLVTNVEAVISQKTDKNNILTAKPLREMPGHTGFLTFATLYPKIKLRYN